MGEEETQKQEMKAILFLSQELVPIRKSKRFFSRMYSLHGRLEPGGEVFSEASSLRKLFRKLTDITEMHWPAE